jgi:hypothetical protein
MLVPNAPAASVLTNVRWPQSCSARLKNTATAARFRRSARLAGPADAAGDRFRFAQMAAQNRQALLGEPAQQRIPLYTFCNFGKLGCRFNENSSRRFRLRRRPAQ